MFVFYKVNLVSRRRSLVCKWVRAEDSTQSLICVWSVDSPEESQSSEEESQGQDSIPLAWDFDSVLFC